MGRPNISPKGSGDPKTESELPLLSSEPFAVIPPAIKGPPLPGKVPPHPFADLPEEEAINDKQGTEEKEKEKEKEEGEELKLICTKFVLCLLGKIGNG